MREVHWEEQTLRVRAFGHVTAAALLEAARALTSDSRYDGLQFIEVDFLDVERTATSLLDVVDDLLAILIGSSYSNANVRLAVIAQDQHIVDLAEALIRFRSATLPQLCIFSDRAAAAEWIAQQPRLSRPSMRLRPP